MQAQDEIFVYSVLPLPLQIRSFGVPSSWWSVRRSRTRFGRAAWRRASTPSSWWQWWWRWPTASRSPAWRSRAL